MSALALRQPNGNATFKRLIPIPSFYRWSRLLQSLPKIGLNRF